jgi:hypothetical protein
MIIIAIGGIFLLLVDLVTLVWLSHTAGRIDGLTSEVKRTPSWTTRLRETVDKKSELHMPSDFEKPPKPQRDE